ncbi:MAG: SUMF1/EgtB/PvdO family nonheme iron enzyme [Anaerolineae bacterium]|nr:SUMF1/EgtB/PvdO family nonheme iron enzyme [Anaerolineae bacterium]
MGGEQSKGWGYRKREDWTQPRYWTDVRFGQTQRGYPVVGVSWYEAVAYAAWLAELLELVRRDKIASVGDDMTLIKGLLAPVGVTVRLPAEAEWEKLAGGAENGRYPWDDLGGPATTDPAAILARANTREAELQGTSPVGMYPLGASRPYGLWDLAGNVWEWTSTKEDWGYRLQGGSWYEPMSNAGCGSRGWDGPGSRFYGRGFRLVSPVGSGS